MAVAKKDSVVFSEKDIIVDTNSEVTQPKFETNFKEKYKSSEFQYEAKITEKSLWDKFKEWLAYCNIPWMIDDTPSTIPNHPEFACHRYDQAILCCLAYKYNIVLHWWADARWFVNQRYRWPEDRYPPMFIHHRMRNNDYR